MTDYPWRGHTPPMGYSSRIARRPKSLRDWRTGRGMTLKEAAAATGYSLPGYHKLEAGLRHPKTPEQMKRLMKVTGVSVEVLAGVA